jgi:hypothetical protein
MAPWLGLGTLLTDINTINAVDRSFLVHQCWSGPNFQASEYLHVCDDSYKFSGQVQKHVCVCSRDILLW